MKNKVLLFLSADMFQGFVWKDGALVHEQTFADNQEGREKFTAFLRTWRAPAYLLTDLIEEDFRHETVLHLRGREHTAQIQRKYEQFYRNTTFRQATLHQRQLEGRRDDDMLFSALTNPATIQIWLDIILQQHTPLAGIYSVPGISKPLVRNINADHILLLSWEKHSGLRQTYFNTKRLYLSRLTPVNDGQSFSEVVSSEVARTQQYLKSLSLLPLGQTLRVHILCHANDRHELQSTLRDAGDMSYEYQDIHELAASLKSKDSYSDSDATHLLLHLLAVQPPHTHYAAAEHTHFFKLWQLNTRLLWLGGLLTLASLLWSSISLLEGGWMNDDRSTFEAQTQRLTQQTQQITRGFANNLAPAADMKSAVTSLRTLHSYSPPPETILAGLGNALADFPRIRIDSLSWQSGSGNSDTIQVGGQLEGWDNNYRGSLGYLDHFQQALKQQHYGVSALTLPLDISSKGSITDNTLEGTGNPAQFSLRLTWEPPQ
ncbi:MAG: hypothetical protein GC139_06680 [Sideroxydans sp.]|nr:hypothetical protein [Sideroxydans sp.]